MTATARAAASASAPTSGSLVQVRGQRWVVADVSSVPGAETLVELSSIEDGRYGQSMSVVWEVEPNATVIDTGLLPRPDELDPPADIAALLDAARWSAATSADVYHLQAPFRAGVMIEDYQLEPLARALIAPRVNLLLADDVGLGKTIEAGLVALELLLRHRARSVLIVCPAGLTGKWRDEMAEKFGLDFTVIDAEACARLRRLRGSAANAFRSYPLAIVSLPWLRTRRAQRLLNEILPEQVDPRQRTFDLLILDEAHHVAPAAPHQKYAIDSQQTKLIRSLTPHCEHRLFLTATPHNGYPESFGALLELVDDQRFARGAPIDPASQRETVIRRLKTDVVTSTGERFRQRRSAVLEVDYTDADKQPYALIERLVAVRRGDRAVRRVGRRTDVVALLLKKRLYSSPAAFARTAAVVRAGLTGRGATPDWDDADDLDDWPEDYLDTEDERDTLDDEERTRQEDDAVRRVTRELGGDAGEPEVDSAEALLDQMAAWAMPYAHRPDAKAQVLIDYLTAVCRDGSGWNNERVVVFTEYRDTQIWLEELLRAAGFTHDYRVALLHGGLVPDERDRIRTRFQSAPGDTGDTKLRILLATDAAAEGIDLHWHCHRLVNYDIPFNPNRLEQRIGRIDRYGQQHEPEVRHFVATGWQDGRRGFEGDVDFLARIAMKIAQVEADLGSANPVLATAVQRVMLGERVTMAELDTQIGARRRLGSDAGVREQVARLRAQLDATVEQLELTPERVERVVRTGLRLARQPSLTRAVDPDVVFDVPPLTGTWVRASAGLPHPLRPEELRPITFDQNVIRDRREDVVYAHLSHPLVAMSTRLLTAAVGSEQLQLSRATMVRSAHPDLAEPLAIAYARFMVVGGDAVRLHEEVLFAGGWIRADGRFARLENLSLLASLVRDALSADAELPSLADQSRIVEGWDRTLPGLVNALDGRVSVREDQVRRALDQRREAELRRNADNFDRFGAVLTKALVEPESDLLPDLHTEEEAQLIRDRQAMRDRLDRLPAERADEADRIGARYAAPTAHAFPLALVVVVPVTWVAAARG